MQLAVVEYSSKSGDVWQHTRGRPNYLADPLTEIDPTSFGCYVSAFESVHVPLVGLVTGSSAAAVSGSAAWWRRAVKRLSGSWPATYDLSYLAHFDALLVVHQTSDAHELVRLLRRLRGRADSSRSRGARRRPPSERPRLPLDLAASPAAKTMPTRSANDPTATPAAGSRPPFLIGVPTQPWGILRERAEKDERVRRELVAFMNECDVFVSVVQSTVGWYQQQTKTPVVYVPQPYPAAYARRFARPRLRKEKVILVAGVTQRDNIRQGQRVARELQRRFPEYVIWVPKVADLDYDFRELARARYEVLPFETWRQHLKTLARASLVINTDYTQTRGRVQTDCAAVGTPSLGGNSDGQVDLFPELASTPEVSEDLLVTRGERLLRDGAWYDALVDQAQARLQKYDYEESRARLELVVRQYSSQ